jgi:rRNA processing protein Gar1
MSEIKKQFTGGKMNKDVDERLVPTGEYRDAMNIQVSTSEGSDVGTIQNILGNMLGVIRILITP